MWKHRTDDDGNVGLGNMAIDPHLHLRIGQQAAGQLGQPGGFDGPRVVKVLGSHDSWFMIVQLG
jgi:hypothetical protein